MGCCLSLLLFFPVGLGFALHDGLARGWSLFRCQLALFRFLLHCHFLVVFPFSFTLWYSICICLVFFLIFSFLPVFFVSFLRYIYLFCF